MAIDSLVPGELPSRLNKLMVRAGFPRNWWLIPLAAFIGSVSGLVALGYGWIVHQSEQFFFGYIAGGDLMGSRIWLVVALPAAGGLLVGLIKKGFQLPLIAHGVPDVMESLARRGGRMKLRAGAFAAINSAVTLGSGGSTGQEGPIIHIGSVVGSAIGQALGATREHMDTLVGCGAAAGLAAIFKAPITGVLLALEVLLRDFSPRTLMPIVIASVFAVTVTHAVGTIGHPGDASHGVGALFSLPPEVLHYNFTYVEILPYLFLGISCGVVGWCFTHLLYSFEHRFHHFPIPSAIKPMVGGLMVGLMGLVFLKVFGHVIIKYAPPPFFGNGYPVVEALLSPSSYVGATDNTARNVTLLFLLFLVLGKVVGTSLTLGSGASGGTFAPCLFIGAATGGAMGLLIQKTGLIAGINPATYALAGMAGVLSASVHCPLTAFILVFEITGDYNVILPVMLVTITATVVSQLITPDSIYTLALREMGVRIGALADLGLLRRIEVGNTGLAPAVVVRAEDSVSHLFDLARHTGVSDFVVVDPKERYAGMVLSQDLRTTLLEPEAMPLVVAGDLMRTDIPTIHPDDTLDIVLEVFVQYDTTSLPVLSPDQKVLGTVARASLNRHYQDAIARVT